MSKANSYKDKIKKDKEEREARRILMASEEDPNPEVAQTEEPQTEEPKTEVNTNVNTNIDEGWTTGGTRTKMVGLYFEPEVAAALNKLNKQKGRGYKSYIANKLVKDYLKEEGIKF